VNFVGRSQKVLDSKGRLSIPQDFRDKLPADDADLVLTQARGGGLTAYPMKAWEAFREGLAKIEDQDIQNALNHLYIAPHRIVSFDAQGRIPISKDLRAWAGLIDESRNVFVVGSQNRIDIYSEQHYAEILRKSEEMVATSPKLSGLGLP